MNKKNIFFSLILLQGMYAMESDKNPVKNTQTRFYQIQNDLQKSDKKAHILCQNDFTIKTKVKNNNTIQVAFPSIYNFAQIQYNHYTEETQSNSIFLLVNATVITKYANLLYQSLKQKFPTIIQNNNNQRIEINIDNIYETYVKQYVLNGDHNITMYNFMLILNSFYSAFQQKNDTLVFTLEQSNYDDLWKFANNLDDTDCDNFNTILPFNFGSQTER
jgi:hypothetical protein